MKAKRIVMIIQLVVVLIGVAQVQAQNCGKQKFCESSLYGEGFDYRSQTRSASLSQGDTVRTNIVVYADQVNRLLVCGDNKLGKINFKVYEAVSEMKKYVRSVNKTEEWQDEVQKDAKGRPLKDEWGDPLVKQKLVPRFDTVWGRKIVVNESLVFDSQKSGKGYWQEDTKKSRRLIIEVIVAKQSTDVEGCVNISVGFKPKKKRDFTKE